MLLPLYCDRIGNITTPSYSPLSQLYTDVIFVIITSLYNSLEARYHSHTKCNMV